MWYKCEWYLTSGVKRLTVSLNQMCVTFGGRERAIAISAICTEFAGRGHGAFGSHVGWSRFYAFDSEAHMLTAAQVIKRRFADVDVKLADASNANPISNWIDELTAGK